MSSNAIELVRKLVPRVVMEAGIEKPKAAESLYTIYGVVTALKDGNSDYGTFTKLIGQFEATRVSDRKVFRAPVAFLPEPMHGMIVAAFKNSESEKPSLQFAATVGIKPTNRAGGTGYEFTVTPLVQPAESDALIALRNQAVAALPSPVKAEVDKSATSKK